MCSIAAVKGYNREDMKRLKKKRFAIEARKNEFGEGDGQGTNGLNDCNDTASLRGATVSLGSLQIRENLHKYKRVAASLHEKMKSACNTEKC